MITLKDIGGNVLGGMPLTIVLDGKTYARNTDAKGQVSFAIPNIVPKTYKVSIVFNGTDKYAASSSSANVIVKKAPTEIGANDLEMELGDKSKLVYVLVPADAKGKCPL